MLPFCLTFRFRKYFIFLVVFGVQILGTPKAQALDLSIGNSSSSTSRTNSLSLSHRFSQAQKLSLSLSSSKDTSITTDGSGSAVKANYSYRFVESGLSLRIGAKKSNDYYFYESTGADLKATFPVYEIEQEEKGSLVTRLSFKVESQLKQYSKLNNESFYQNAFNIGVEQDLTNEWSVGIESTFYTYSSGSKESTAAFQAKTTTYTDISDTINQTSKSSIGIDVEYALDDFATGLTVSKSNPQISGQSAYTSYDVFIDYTFFEKLTTSLTFSRGKSEVSTSYSDSWGFGFGWSP